MCIRDSHTASHAVGLAGAYADIACNRRIGGDCQAVSDSGKADSGFRGAEREVRQHSIGIRQCHGKMCIRDRNTISSVCRENPDRARELLLTLSLYYRQTLANEQYMIRLSTCLLYTSRCV